MSDVYVIVAAQKEYFPIFDKALTLTHSGQRAEVTILYSHGGQKQSWTSPEFDPAGVEKIDVEIDGAALPAASAFAYRPVNRR